MISEQNNADRWAIDQCKAYFHLTDEDELRVTGTVGVGYMLALWDQLGDAMYEHPLAILRQEVWHATMSKAPEPFHPPIGFWRSLAPDSDVLDYGCGTAEILRRNWLGYNHNCALGMDASIAIQRYAHYKFRGSREIGIVSVPSYKLHRSFDAIICTDVFEHVEKPVELLKYLWDLLKPHGQALFVFSVSYPHAGHLKEAIDQQPAWWNFLQRHATIVQEDGYVWAIKKAPQTLLTDQSSGQSARTSASLTIPAR